jgi:AraC family transcriptional regulator, regulatory protein of adaptative response / DNA-3-methyladenine glycosylase II
MTQVEPAGGLSGLDPEVCERARLARDPRFDGRFFIGVITTGVYCRPICPVRPPMAKNVRFYASAAAAAEAGFRPCLRCRPESSPGAPAWRGTETTVSRALRLIEDGALDSQGVEALAARLGVGSRHLSRLFLKHIGAAPVQVAQTRRLHLAKKLLDETNLSVTEIAYAAGYGSLRRFNEVILATYQRSPSAIRKLRRSPSERSGLRLELAYRPPFDWNWMSAFFGSRAVSGVESVEGGVYRRTINVGGRTGSIAVQPLFGTNRLELAVNAPDTAAIATIAARARRAFDLDADPLSITRDLGRDGALAPRVRAAPGLRVPGAWNGFEIAVRAILGQSVTVAGARTLAARVAARYGSTVDEGEQPCALAFPTPDVLAEGSLKDLGVAATRADAIKNLAKQVADGKLDLETPQELETFVGTLQEIQGIGPWTAQYIALRALGHPDAFPVGDLGLLKGAGLCIDSKRALTHGALARRAEEWRPWRAYAAMHLWSAYAEPRQR